LRKLGSCHREVLHAAAHEITDSLTTTCANEASRFSNWQNTELAKHIWFACQPRAFPVSA
jgi:hypothetical protein